MDEIIEQLQRLGFAKYEARAYVTLLRRSPLNGYELAKQSGIPRANVYAVVRRLEEHGAVLRLDSPGGARYTPVTPAELLQRLRNKFEGILDATQDSLSTLAAPPEQEPVLNARGYGAMIDHARNLLDAAKQRVLMAVWPPEARGLGESLAQAEARGVEITTLCLENCPAECGFCRGHIYRYPVLPAQSTRWLVLVRDGEELLTAEIGQGEEAVAVRTRQRLLVDLAHWYIRHSIALAALVKDVGGRLNRLLTPKTRAILDAVGPDNSGGWLAHMRQLIARSSGRAEL